MEAFSKWPGLVLLASCYLPSAVGEEVRFNEHIRPLLAEHCLECHGPDESQREGDLRLDVENLAKRGAIVAHHPGESPLMERISSADETLRMPPADAGKSLTAAEIDLFRSWIAAGAPYEGHWSLQPIASPTIPMTDATLHNPIDQFIVTALRKHGLNLSPPINRQQWIRRATFDLWGLPPTWEQVQAFTKDQSPEAFEKVVDRLLESPRYGERWGRHWLDIARYADTHGGAAIGFTRFPFSYTYRDYVIQTMNEDVPYNRFVTEQLAADQLDLDPHDRALAGLGLLTVGMQFRNIHDVIDDQIDVVTRGLLGLTVACARCHDHKYDPISSTDYYSLYATLASSSQPESLPTVGHPPDTDAYRQYQSELAQLQTVHEDMRRDQGAVMRGRLRMQVGLYLRELAQGAPEQDLSAAFLSYRSDDLRPLVLNRWRTYLAKMPEDDPVFGPWMQLSTLPSDGFQQQCSELLQGWRQGNDSAKKADKPHVLAADAPQWNPRVLDAIANRHPATMEDVADAYGGLFADVHRGWLEALVHASLEATGEDAVIPDEDPRHAEINSAVNAQLRRHLYHPDTPTAMSDEVAAKLLNRTVRDKLSGRKGAIHQLHLSSPGAPPRAMVLEEAAAPQPFHVLRRGNPIDRGEQVDARFLAALSPPDAETFPVGSRRLALAQQMVHPDNPLLRRVIVNWVWQHHFGEGLVRTPDDFGVRGESPTHPKLLDYLATKFMEDGWSLKRLHRRIMLSAVYGQAAVEDSESRFKDPDNRYLWRMPRRRLDLEAMRDAMLAVSGELDVAVVGGRPFDLLSTPIVPRRTVYGFVNRDIVSSLASTFDQANPNSCTAKRPETTVPQQTLFALNSDFIQDRAKALASLSSNAASGEERVRALYRRAYSREPDAVEMRQSLQFLESSSIDSTKDRAGVDPGGQGDSDLASEEYDGWQQLAHVLLAANEFLFVD